MGPGRMVWLFAIWAALGACARDIPPGADALELRARGTEVVIVIPGITGSELRTAAGEAVWPPRLLHLFGDFSALAADKTGTATVPLVAGPPLADYYEALPVRLESLGYKVYRFGYDWRADAAASAVALQALIQKTGASSVNLVAHSMGGLVAAAYLRAYGPGKVRRLVTLGTPFLGTPGSLKTLEIGDFVAGAPGWLLRPLFTQLFKNHPAWYQLLPSPSYFASVAPYYVRKTVVGPAASERFGTAAATAAFVRSRPWANAGLLARYDLGLSAEVLVALLREVDAYFFVGLGHPTTGELEFVYEQVDGAESFVTCQAHPVDGDGAVVTGSATIGGRLESIHAGHSYFLHERHGQLLNNEAVIAQVARILRGQTAPAAGLRQTQRL